MGVWVEEGSWRWRYINQHTNNVSQHFLNIEHSCRAFCGSGNRNFHLRTCKSDVMLVLDRFQPYLCVTYGWKKSENGAFPLLYCKRNRASVGEVTLVCRHLDIETMYFLIVSYGVEHYSPASSEYGTKDIRCDLLVNRVKRIIKNSPDHVITSYMF